MKKLAATVMALWCALVSAAFAPFFAPAINVISGVLASTWNPSDKSSTITLSSGNLVATISTGVFDTGGVRATTAKTGKYYFEVVFSGLALCIDGVIGVATLGQTIGAALGADSVSAGYYKDGSIIYNNSTVQTGDSFTNGDIIGVAFDTPSHVAYFSKNNTWQLSANPSSNSGGVSFVTTSAMSPKGYLRFFTGSSGCSVELRTSAGSQTYAPPTGFSSFN